ncbi:putative acetyltransferase [Streptomyces sp. 840.1]|uniref:GNAT family N-acetyltransferase n=1 Tax=Streptomyces sp. 840.1 TaxID=2485152 RepID=UPI000F49CA38|nr:GNAT family N-acetyltransferase [Streptomyces sp. 840.1]ROQ66050.1 putative acetyltransferase [Streptomyces sp. 840.1]
MSDRPGISVSLRPATAPADDGLSALLADYHLCTEREKGRGVADVTGLPDRYRAEVEDPGAAFADAVVLVARAEQDVVGCLVVTAPSAGRSEVKRLWTDPGHRGRGIASALLRAAFDEAARGGADTVRLSVWKWRTGAIALYGRLGFTVTTSWDERADLVCMERAVRSARGTALYPRDGAPAARPGTGPGPS